MKFFLFVIAISFYNFSFASDTTISYSCKYRYTKQTDSTNKGSKFSDIMILTLFKSSTLYYSYLRQFGQRNFENDLQKNENSKDHTVTIDPKKNGSYFFTSESEVIEVDYLKKEIKVSDNLIGNAFTYTETLSTPMWKIENDTATILNQKCQKATTTFKGRNYIAWFAPSIPLNIGPWLFNGLPGLILKVSDTKNQFVFECVELNTPNSTTKVYKPYTDLQKISKKTLEAKKKLLAQNFIEYEQSEGHTLTENGHAPTKRPDKPYNPIELAQ